MYHVSHNFVCMTQLYLIELSNFEMKMREIARDRDEGQVGEEEKKKTRKRKRERQKEWRRDERK